MLCCVGQDHREPESAVRLFGVDLLAGLQQTHACGYLHGDLRPSNVLIDEYGILKLSGFGLARAVSSEEEEEEERGGCGASAREGGSGGNHSRSFSQQQSGSSAKATATAAAAAEVAALAEGRDPRYMAPELFSVGAEAMSFASDFWSLGCVLYELLTGEPPFRSTASATVAEIITHEVRERERRAKFGFGGRKEEKAWTCRVPCGPKRCYDRTVL